MRMNYSGKYAYLLTCALVVLALPLRVFSQSDTVSQSGRKNVPDTGSQTDIHSLYAGVGGGSNMIYLGSTISQDKPFFSTGVTYGYRNSLFVSGSVSHLNGVDPFVAFYTLSGSYSHAFNSWFDISAAVSGYKTPESLQQALFSDFAFINLTTGFDWKLIYTKLSVGDLISDENRVYFQIRNSRYFEIPDLLKGKVSISFDPNINILFGQLIRIVTTTGVIKYGNSPPFRHIKKDHYTTIESYSYKYGLMDLEFSIPVTFSYGIFTVEFEPDYILPVHTNSYYPTPEGFSFFVNAYIKIF
jgi:hypothetical protein